MSHDDMRKVVVDLTISVINKGILNDELMFKDEIWINQKKYLNKN